MTIQIGDRIPEVNIKRINGGIDTIDTHTFFEGKKMVLFSVPGAFTPTCSESTFPVSSNTSKHSATKASASPACRSTTRS